MSDCRTVLTFSAPPAPNLTIYPTVALPGAASLVPVGPKFGAYTAAVGELVLVNAASGPVTVTAPLSPAVGSLFSVGKVDGGSSAVTVEDDDGALISGDLTSSIGDPYAVVTYMWVGVGWLITATVGATTGGGPGPDPDATVISGGSAGTTFTDGISGGTAGSTYTLPGYSGGTA